ncbi:c-type cytochrome [Dinoroseobacter sp. S124A]|uniref:c-type cytochrome n=1 Tax=Dinoroseobacter sp. S124A TaxID=3415128 RepID=UPI003C7D8407
MRALTLICAVTLAHGAQADGLLPWQDPAAVARGAEIYAGYCAACHGETLEGQVPDWRSPGEDGLLPAPPHDATGHTWHHADLLLFRITKYGTEALVGGSYRSNMAGFDGVLSDAEILAVLGYIKSTWPDRIRAAHDRVNAAAQ